jgi:hypothetical protein
MHGRAPFKPSQEANKLIGDFAAALAALQQRDRGHVLATVQRTYFQDLTRKASKKTPNANKQPQAKPENAEYRASEPYKALKAIEDEIAKYRESQPANERKSALPADLYDRRTAALAAATAHRAAIKSRSGGDGGAQPSD